MKLLLTFGIRKTAAFVGLLLVSALGLVLFNSSSSFPAAENESKREAPAAPASRDFTPPTILYGMAVDKLQVSEDFIRRDQLFADLLKDYYVTPRVLQQLNALPRSVFEFRRVAAGKKYTVVSANDCQNSAKALIYESSPVDYYIFHFEDSLSIEACQREVTRIEKHVTGEIESTLSETIEKLGISHELTNRFVDIFAWQVDFQRLQKGDRFKLIYEEYLADNNPVGIAGISAIYFEHFGNRYYAFPFDQGDGTDYFDEQGKSLRKALLKYPIEFTSISSRYNLNRFHPIAKVFRAHLGTDFAAPTGTPIRSVGDGIVEEAQFKANNGNYVKIRHNGTYSTAYLHMSRIGAGMAPGVRVRQGQTIGYVGSTGLATGPHVCYRLWRNGVQVDALRIELPPSQPVRGNQVGNFECVREDLIRRLDEILFADPFPAAAVAPL